MARVHRLIARAARIYWRIRKPRTLGVRAIVLNARDEIALVRHTYIDGWYLPGGGVRKGESVAGALARELREELAICDMWIERILGVYHNRREAKDDHVVVFVARAADAVSLRAADGLEIAEAAWFALEALPNALSPATKRRVAEFRTGGEGSGDW